MMMMIEITPIMIYSGIAGFILILAVTLGGSIYSLHRVQVKGGEALRIKLRNVNKTYQTSIESIQVLKEIEFTMESGSWLPLPDLLVLVKRH